MSLEARARLSRWCDTLTSWILPHDFPYSRVNLYCWSLSSFVCAIPYIAQDEKHFCRGLHCTANLARLARFALLRQHPHVDTVSLDFAVILVMHD